MHNIEESQAICDAAYEPDWVNRYGEVCVVRSGIPHRIGVFENPANASLAAHARTALPAVLSELAEARKVMAQMAEALEPFAAEYKVASEAGEEDDNLNTTLVDAACALEAYRKLEKPDDAAILAGVEERDAAPFTAEQFVEALQIASVKRDQYKAKRLGPPVGRVEPPADRQE